MVEVQSQEARQRVIEALKSGDLSRAGIVSLQNDLKELGYFSASTYPNFGPRTASSVVEFIKENPEILADAHPDIIRRLEGRGHVKALAQIGQDNMDAVHSGIENTLARMGDNLDNASWRDKRALQTLLTIGGYNSMDNIDGIIGGETRRALGRYKSGNPELRLTEQGAEQEQGQPAAPEEKPAAPSSESNPLSSLLRRLQGAPPEPSDSNGFGVSARAIEKAWGTQTGVSVPAGADEAPSGRPLIVIDLGHGADLRGRGLIDPGAVSPHNRLSEVAVVDPFSKELAQQLYEKGYDVAFTRNPGENLRVSGDYSKTLTSRAGFANALGSELGAPSVTFISLHCNSSTNSAMVGSQIYVRGSRGEASSNQSAHLGDRLAEAYSLDKNTPTTIHYANFAVLRHFENGIPKGMDANKCSAALVEFGFLSNAQDSARLKSLMEKPQEAARQLASGIDRHVQIKDPETKLIARNTPEVNIAETVATGLKGAFQFALRQATPLQLISDGIEAGVEKIKESKLSGAFEASANPQQTDQAAQPAPTEPATTAPEREKPTSVVSIASPN